MAATVPSVLRGDAPVIAAFSCSLRKVIVIFIVLVLKVASQSRLHDETDLGADPEPLREAVKEFLASSLATSGGSRSNDFMAHHRLVEAHCKARKPGCTWRDYHALLDVLRRPFRDLKDPGATVLSLRKRMPWGGKLQGCDRLHNPTAEQFLKQVVRNRPAIITGVAENWTALTTWTWEYLMEQLGDMPVVVSVNPTETFDGPVKAADFDIDQFEYVVGRPDTMMMTFSQYAGMLMNARDWKHVFYYLQYFPISRLKNLSSDLGRLAFAEWLHRRYHLIWFGDGRTTGNTHFDSEENLMVMIRGTKEFILMDPMSGWELYADVPMAEVKYEYNPATESFNMHNKSLNLAALEPDLDNKYSPVNPKVRDTKRFPRFSKIRNVLRCTIHEGEILYNPGHWWHHVESQPDKEGKNIGVNMFTEPLYNRYNALDAHYLTNRHYAHLHNWGNTAEQPLAQVSMDGLVHFVSKKNKASRRSRKAKKPAPRTAAGVEL